MVLKDFTTYINNQLYSCGFRILRPENQITGVSSGRFPGNGYANPECLYTAFCDINLPTELPTFPVGSFKVDAANCRRRNDLTRRPFQVGVFYMNAGNGFAGGKETDLKNIELTGLMLP